MVLALLAEEDMQDIRIDVCLLEDLMTEGPFAYIVRSTRAPHDQADWLSRCWSA